MLAMEMPWARGAAVWAGAMAEGRVRRAMLRRVKRLRGMRVMSRCSGRRVQMRCACRPEHYRSRAKTYRSTTGEGVFERGALRGEHLSAVGGDDPVVFEADAELAGDVDAGFVGECHVGRQGCGIAADDIGPLVVVQADVVAYARGEQFVVGSEAACGE